jgi:hypothetical protein
MRKPTQAVTEVLDVNEKQAQHTRNIMIVLAFIALAMTMATRAWAAEAGIPEDGVAGVGNGVYSYQPSAGDEGALTTPSLPPPTFNPSTPYTVPQSPEVPVSPASPGSVFGNR